MNKNHYQSALVSSVASTRFLKWLVMILALAIMMLAYHIMTLQYAEKTVVIPANFNQAVTVDGHVLSDTYVIQMGRYLTGLGYTFHADNVRAQFDELLTYFSPVLYARLKPHFEVDDRRIQKSRISRVLHVSHIEVYGNNGYFMGTSEGYIGAKKVSAKPTVVKVGLSFDGVLRVVDYGEFVQDPDYRGEARFVRVTPERE